MSVLGTAAIGTMATDQAASAEPPGADDTSQEPGGRTDTPTLGFAETAPPNLSNPVDPPYTVELGPGVDRGLAPFVPEPATITVRPGQPLGDVPLPPGVFMPPGVNLPPAVQEALVQKAQEIGAYLDAHSDALVGDNRRSEDLVAMYEATRGAINDTHVFEALNDLGIERTTFEVNVGVLGSAERNAGDVTKGKVEGGLTYRLAVEAGPYIASANPQIAVSLIQIEQVGAAVGLRDLPGWYGLIDPEYGTAQEHHKGVAISYVMPPGEPLPDTLPSLFAPGDMRESSTLRITPVHAEWAQDRYLNYHQDAVDIATTEAGDPGMIQVTRTGDTVELGTGNLQVHISEPGVHSTVKGFREALTLRDVTGDVYFPGNLTFDHTDPAGRAAYETALRQGIPDFGFPEGTTVYARFGMTDPLHYTTTPSLSLPLKSENGQRQVGPYVNANRIGHHPWHGWVQAVAVGPEIGAKVNFSWFDTFGDRRFTGAGDLVVRDGRYGVANIEGQLTNRLFSSLPGGSVKLSAAQIAQLRDLYSQSRLRTITDQEFVDRLYSIVPEFAALRDNRGVGMALEPVLAYDLPAFLGMIPDSDQVRSLVEGSVRAAAPPGTLIAFDGSVPDVTGAVPEPPDAFDAYALSLPAGALGPDADFSAAFNGVPNSFGVIGVPDGPGGIGTLLGPDPGFGFGSPEPFGSYADAAAAGAVGVDADFGGAFAESGSPFAEAFAGYGESGVPGISISGEGLDGPGYGESGVPGISVSEGGGADGLSDPGVAQTGTLGSEVEGSDDADDGVGTYAAAAVAAGAVGVDADFGGAFAESGSPFAEAFAGYGESGVPGISISGEGLDGPGYSESGVPGISVSEGEAGYAPSEPSFSQTGTLSNDLGEVGDGPTDGDAAGAADESGAPGISVSEDGDGYTPSEPSFAQTGTLGNDPAAEPGSSTVDSFGGSEDSGTVDGFGGSEDSSTGVGGFGGSEDSSTGVGDVGGPGSVTGETDTGRGLGVAGEPAIGSGDDGGGSGDRGAGGTGSGDDGSRSTEGGVPGTSVSVDGDGYAASESSFSQTGTLGNEASGSDDGFGSSLVDSFGGFGDSAGGFGGGDDGSGGFGDSAGGFGGGDSGSGGFGDSAGGFGGGDSGSGGFGDSGFGGGDSGSGGSGGGDSGSSSFSTSSGSFGGGDSGW